MKTKYNIEFKRKGVFIKNWRWKITSNQNGKVIAASTEGFKNRLDCNKNLLLTRDAINEFIYPGEDDANPSTNEQ